MGGAWPKSKAVPTDHNGQVLPYTSIPNALLRSQKLDVFDKIVFCVIASYKPAFPSYEKIAEGTGLSRERIWKSLKTLEDLRLIYRRPRGRGVEYFVFWEVFKNEELKKDCLKFGDRRRSPSELLGLVARALNSSPDELVNGRNSSPDELV